jgi:hypothetical protein
MHIHHTNVIDFENKLQFETSWTKPGKMKNVYVPQLADNFKNWPAYPLTAKLSHSAWLSRLVLPKIVADEYDYLTVIWCPQLSDFIL